MLSRVGYVVDQIRPDALRQVSVGDHKVYIFAFQTEASQKKALKTCEKLKSAELGTPLVLLSLLTASPELLNHQTVTLKADAYVINPKTESPLLDAMDLIVGSPMPASIKGNMNFLSSAEKKEKTAEFQKKIDELQKKIGELEGIKNKTEEALEAQRNFYKPKLKALLEGQKIQIQSETERLKVQLSEVEAKLLDRELKVKELEQFKERHKQKLEELMLSHEKAQNTLREFYQNKIKSLEADKKVG